jgi:hypothetical protein
MAAITSSAGAVPGEGRRLKRDVGLVGPLFASAGSIIGSGWAVARLKAKGVAAEPLLKAGKPAEEILDAADEGQFDVIVIGSRGKSAAARFLMGSVSERVVRHATRPVLVVR